MTLRIFLSSVVFFFPAIAYGGTPTPAEIAAVALADAEKLPDGLAKQRRYFWNQTGSAQEFAALVITLNTAVAEFGVAYDIVPTKISEHLYSVDLTLCCRRADNLAAMLRVWEMMRRREPWFHVHIREKIQAVKTTDAKKDGKAKEAKADQVIVKHLPAPHLGDIGLKLEELCGPMPIVNIAWFTKESLNTADGGFYYVWRELVPVEANAEKAEQLEKYLLKRGASQEQAKRTNSDEKAGFISRVTGKARAVTMFAGSGTALSRGRSIIAITDDPFDNNVDASFDPFRELIESKTNGHEVFVTMPSGWIEFSLWNGDKKLVSEAPPNLVADHEIPRPYTRRLQGAIACLRCHGQQQMWQPFTNEVAVMAGDRVRIHGAVNGGDQHDTIARLAALYGGDLSQVLRTARIDWESRIFAASRQNSAMAIDGLTTTYNGYEYDYVTPSAAVLEIGGDLNEGDETGVASFRRLVPPLNPDGAIRDDPIVGRLHVEYLDVESGKPAALKLHRRQWEQVLADVLIRATRAKGETANE